MSIQRIDIEHKRTHGWQARAYVAPGKRLAAFFGDQSNGNSAMALRRARQAEELLKQEAQRLKSRPGV